MKGLGRRSGGHVGWAVGRDRPAVRWAAGGTGNRQGLDPRVRKRTQQPLTPFVVSATIL